MSCSRSRSLICAYVAAGVAWVTRVVVTTPVAQPAFSASSRSVVTGVPVVPFRFGTVLPDERSVAHDVLSVGQDVLTTALDRLRARAQFTLRATYEPHVLLREVLTTHPELAPEARARPEAPPHAHGESARPEAAPSELPDEQARPTEELATPPPTGEPPGEAAPDATGEQARRSELLAGAIEARRATDADLLHGSLAPLALAARSAESAEEDGLVDASFLVEDARRDEFEQAVEELSRDWHGRVRLRLLGPLAPYDFAADATAPDPAW